MKMKKKMVYTYTLTYSSSFHGTVTSLCKSILPFSLRGRRPEAPDQKIAKRRSDSLKWQQESFHRILHLTALHDEGIVPEADVVAFRTHILDTLIAAPKDHEPAGVVRDKLLFLQELLHAKCISAAEYHCSKRPLLQRFAGQGIELDCRDVIVRCPTTSSEEEWSVIELRDKEPPATAAAEKPEHRTPVVSFIKSAASSWAGKGANKDISFSETTKGDTINVNDKSSILMPESSPVVPAKAIKGRRKMLHDM